MAELGAESVAFVVCDALGIQAADWTFDSVAGWAGGGRTAILAIKAAGTRILHTADRILSALDLAAGDAAEVPSQDPT